MWMHASRGSAIFGKIKPVAGVESEYVMISKKVWLKN